MKNSCKSALPRIAITLGEPAGIGPELIVRIAQLSFNAELTVIGDSALLLSVAEKLKLPLVLKEQKWLKNIQCHQPGQLFLVPVEFPQPVKTGTLCSENAATTLNILNIAHQLAEAGKVDGIVTAPVHKANLNSADASFLGHTEYFAKAANVSKVVMMLASGGLRITLATTHIPLSQVSQAVTSNLLRETIQVILSGFARFGMQSPKLAVCGLNPHAGEDGLLGHEDNQNILPVIQEFANKGALVTGPYPADTLFTPKKRTQFDVFLAMYHDQGLPVVKAFGFGECANVTLGLPYIRTSVDHGTALDIAAEFSANADSLAYAINYALQLAVGKLPK